jgi:Zn-dependent protease
MGPDKNAAPMSGSFRLFRLAGVSVHLHWSWLLVAGLELQYRRAAYASFAWNLAEYLALFGIVLLHEFGHALACRQVGGRADHIILWPLGGIAFVSPPPRPGAWLWSIAAGPLVNVVLVPVFVAADLVAQSSGLPEADPDAFHFIRTLGYMNFVLLVFNLLPVYPLDGGQILQSILWFFIGWARSLLVVSVIGLVVAAAAIVLAFVQKDAWIGILAVFVALRSWTGFQMARQLAGPGGLPRFPDAVGPVRQHGASGLGVEELVQAHCQRCGATSLFPAAARGTVQACQRCRASIDFGPVEEGGWWRGEGGGGR